MTGIFEPPPGFVDFNADADWSPDFRPLLVPGVGQVQAKPPGPRGLPLLVGAFNLKNEPPVRHASLMRFVRTHLADDELDRVLESMLDDDAPADAVAKIAEALACWGTARPYLAVINLAYQTAHHWRTIRHRLVMAGINDPMALPSMHILLEATEVAILEAYAGPDGEAQRSAYMVRLYTPPAGEVPEGFDADNVEDAWDAWAKAQGAAAG